MWLTPRRILKPLGHFDLDPAAAPEDSPWPTADRHITPPRDGLAEPWSGRVWLNPPYGREVGLWLSKLADHGSGIALTFARTETAWFQDHVWARATALLFLHRRLRFHLPDGSEPAANAGGPSVLIAYSAADADVLAASGLGGTFVPLVHAITITAAS